MDKLKTWAEKDFRAFSTKIKEKRFSAFWIILHCRAVYSDRDIILLDDPLSAVDAHVGKHIFFECIKKELAEKTVLFVTHQLQYLKDCDEVIMLKDGRIAEKGKHDDLMTHKGEYAELIK